MHHDLEDPDTHASLYSDPSKWIDSVSKEEKSLVLTWRFFPDEEKHIVMLFQAKGFKVVWFDGNRRAALREFIKRGYPAENLFHMQMRRIEDSRIVETLKPVTIDPFDESGRFKDPAVILEEIKNAEQ